MIADIIRTLFDLSFDFLGFHISVGDFVTTIFDLCDWTKIQETSFWTVTSTINELLVPTGLSLLVLFTMIDFIKEAMYPERFTWERAVMIMVKFFIVKFFVSNSFMIMTKIMEICQGLFNSALPVLKDVATTDLADSMAGLIDGNLFEELFMAIVILLVYIPFLGSIIGILVQVFTRIAKLAIGFCCSPIPISLGGSEDQRSSCKGFFLWIAGVGFEGLIIIICANFYITGINSIKASGISQLLAVMLANGLFMAMVSLSSTLAEKFLPG